MKRTLFFVLALAVIPVTVDAQVTELAQRRALAEQGDVYAQYNLGFMYDNGIGVPEDDAEAVRWYRLAAEQGYALAQYELGVRYRNGRGVPKEEMRVLAAQGGRQNRRRIHTAGKHPIHA